MYRWIVARVISLIYRRTFAGQTDLMMRSTAKDVTFHFPGTSTFSADLVGRDQLQAWLTRFSSLRPTFEVRDVTVSGPPWNMSVAVRFRDSIGEDYENEGVEWVRIRWGLVRSLEVFLDTERIRSWEARHPEILDGTAGLVSGPV